MDIAFLSESLVVTEVYRNIEPGYLVTGTQPARYFLEVNAGELDGIVPGDTASLEVEALEETPAIPDWISAMLNVVGAWVVCTLMVDLFRKFIRVIERPEDKPALLPQASAKKSADSYEIETDRMGNIIITRSDKPDKDVFLQFESDKSLVYDLLKKGERKDLDAGWEVRVKRSEPRASILDELWDNSAQPQKSTQASGKPTRYDVTVEAWQERDRLGIWITDKRTDKVLAEWWDEDAREMFEQGFFKPGVPQRSTEKPSRGFVSSVLEYAESVGLLAGSKYAPSPASIPEQQRSVKSKNHLEFLPDSPEFLAYTIDDIGYRDRIDSAFLSAIARVRGIQS
jgi:hypothetical protein